MKIAQQHTTPIRVANRKNIDLELQETKLSTDLNERKQDHLEIKENTGTTMDIHHEIKIGDLIIGNIHLKMHGENHPTRKTIRNQITTGTNRTMDKVKEEAHQRNRILQTSRKKSNTYL